MHYSAPNRTLCDILTDLRSLLGVANLTVREKNVILSLVEETQIVGNRMEAALWDQKDVEYMKKELKKKLKKLEGEDDE